MRIIHVGADAAAIQNALSGNKEPEGGAILCPVIDELNAKLAEREVITQRAAADGVGMTEAAARIMCDNQRPVLHPEYVSQLEKEQAELSAQMAKVQAEKDRHDAITREWSVLLNQHTSLTGDLGSVDTQTRAFKEEIHTLTSAFEGNMIANFGIAQTAMNIAKRNAGLVVIERAREMLAARVEARRLEIIAFAKEHGVPHELWAVLDTDPKPENSNSKKTK
jgi:hypothetical protein